MFDSNSSQPAAAELSLSQVVAEIRQNVLEAAQIPHVVSLCPGIKKVAQQLEATAICKSSSQADLPATTSPSIAEPPAQVGHGMLDARQLEAMKMILMGFPETKIAKILGVNRRTIYRWRMHPEFVLQLRVQAARLREATALRMAELMPRVLEVLERQMNRSNESLAYRAASLLLKANLSGSMSRHV